MQDYSNLELFAGAGGLALGLEKAGLKCQLLNEIDRYACSTLRYNRPNWNVIEDDVRNVSFKKYCQEIAVVSGGVPCQLFSYAGEKRGLNDLRGSLFFEFVRAVKEVEPLVFVAENVRGVLTHDKGRTLNKIIAAFVKTGYRVIPPKVLKAIYYKVPQKRERIFLIGIKEGVNIDVEYPKPCSRIYTIKDALKKGSLYGCDAPNSSGQIYSSKKREVMNLVPPGGYWRDLPVEIQREYMQKSFYSGGGKTGIARRMSWDEPCLTLTTSPAQKQTERCHPQETRPFTIREYARLQTFPDSWLFHGPTNQIYKQIGNAVPVNLAYEIGKQLVKALKKQRD